MSEQNQYTEDNIRSLDWKEHIRMRPGMYIGKLGDGSSPDDGIYILLKEVIDNCIDEFVMGAGKVIEVTIKEKMVTVRDYGRGIPLGKVVDVVSKMNTGGKYDSKAFKKSVGLNGVGTKAVNALSNYFRVESVRDNQQKAAEFSAGNLTLEEDIQESTKRKGTKVAFVADEAIFKNYKYRNEYVIRMLKNYCYLNTGLTIYYNGEKYYSDNGLKDLLEETITEEDMQYPIIHLLGDDIEIALTHSKSQYSEEYHSFVNGQNTTQGGTHLGAFREAIVKTIKEFYNKPFEASDIRKSIVSAVSIKVEEPVFESQTKTKLGSTEIGPKGPSVRTFVNDFIKTKLDNYLHKNPENEEFNLLQAALDIEEDMGDLRYNNIVIATDADVDGMHIRLLLITFFLQFFPELIKDGHLYILQTPLFRVRNKKETIYCYSEQERVDAIEKLKPKPEITRFKGLGEISPDEFKHFIGQDIRLDPVMLDKATSIETLLEFYMGKNTPDRQDFIINNLKVELDVVEK
ncbi:MAG: ATP-binding protein [Flavobacterium sp.]|nr:ATP-binding protein [Flavobacterium sp.]